MRFAASARTAWITRVNSLSLFAQASRLGEFGTGMRFRYLSGAIVVTAVLLLAILALTTRGAQPDPGIRLVQEAPDALRVTWVIAGGFGSEGGLRAGDLVRPVLVPAGSGGWQAYEVLEGARVGQTVVLTRRWGSALDLALFILGIEFLITGLVVHLRASDRGAAARFTALAVPISATLVVFPAVGDGIPWSLVWEWFGSKAGMAAFTYFFLTFPVSRWPLLRNALLWAPIPILTCYSLVVLFRPDLYGLVKVAGYGYMAAGAITSVVAMAWPFVTAAPRAQRRLWPVAVGTGAGVLLYLLGSLIPYLVFRQYLIPAEIAILGIGLLPIGLVWAVLRYPVMGLALGSGAVLQAFFESTSEPMFVVGRDGYLVNASRAGLDLLGPDVAERSAEPFDKVISRMEARGGDGHVSSSTTIRDVLSGQAVHDAEVALSLVGGETAYYSLEGTPLHGESGAVAMAVVVFRDITPRKLREIARQELERQKDEFLATVSHDLRTPIAAIKYSIGVVLANRPVDLVDPLSRMLHNVDQAADIMASQVNDLLDLACLQSGNVQLSRRNSDLRDLIRRAVAAVEPLASSRGQSIAVDLPADPCWVLVDQTRLGRAITNLTANAYKHGRDGGTILLKLLPSPGDVRIAVCDDGPGILESERERIFDRFYRIGMPDSSGSGLGLPIARGMVELHGGSVSVESSPEGGSTFWITLPAPTGSWAS